MEEHKDPIAQIFHGENSRGFDTPVQTVTADLVNQAGIPVTVHDVKPAQDHPVVNLNEYQDVEEPGHLLDFDKAKALIKGDSDAPTTGFIKRLKQRILGQNPGADIREAA